MPVDNARERPESVIGRFRTGERRSHVGIQHNYSASRSVAGRVLVGYSLTEIVLWKYFVRRGR